MSDPRTELEIIDGLREQLRAANDRAYNWEQLCKVRTDALEAANENAAKWRDERDSLAGKLRKAEARLATQEADRPLGLDALRIVRQALAVNLGLGPDGLGDDVSTLEAARNLGAKLAAAEQHAAAWEEKALDATQQLVEYVKRLAQANARAEKAEAAARSWHESGQMAADMLNAMTRERDASLAREEKLCEAWHEMRDSVFHSDNDDQGMDSDQVNYVLSIIDSHNAAIAESERARKEGER